MKRMIELGIVKFRDDHSEPPLRKQHIRPIDFEIEAAAETNDDDIDSEESDEDELPTQVRG